MTKINNSKDMRSYTIADFDEPEKCKEFVERFGMSTFCFRYHELYGIEPPESLIEEIMENMIPRWSLAVICGLLLIIAIFG